MHCVSQICNTRDWEELLPTLDFAYNDTKKSKSERVHSVSTEFHAMRTMGHETVSNPHVEGHIQYLLRLQEAARMRLQMYNKFNRGMPIDIGLKQ